MRPQQQNRRMRGRNNNNNRGGGGGGKGGQNPLTRSYESNGPDVKIRGNAQQVAEKYATLARDAMSSGDRVMAENYLQHAEHYNRIIAAAQAQMPIQNYQQNRGDDFDDDLEDGDDMDAQGNGGERQQPGNDGSGPQPTIEGVPAEVALNGEDNGGQRENFRNRDRNNRNRDGRDRNRDYQNGNRNGDYQRRDVQQDQRAQQPAVNAETASDNDDAGTDALPAFLTEQAPAPQREENRRPRRPRREFRGEDQSAQPQQGETASETITDTMSPVDG